jgi:hypothetical protein
MFSGNRILNVVSVVLAAIGLVTVPGAAGMTAAHFSMTHGMRSCGQAMHLWQQGQDGESGESR